MQRAYWLATIIVLSLLLCMAFPPAFAAPPTINRPMEFIAAKVEGDQPATVDPAWSYDSASAELIMQVYETLIKFDGERMDQFLPALATDWTAEELDPPEISPEGLEWHYRYTFEIRTGVQWHDPTYGTVAPADVAHSFERAMVQDRTGGPTWMFYEALLNTWSAAGLGYDLSIPAEAAIVGQMIDHAVESNATHVWFNLAFPGAYAPFVQILSQIWGSIMCQDWIVNHVIDTLGRPDWDGVWGDYTGWVAYHDPWMSPLDDPTPIMMGCGPFEYVTLDYTLEQWEVSRFVNYWRGWPINWPAMAGAQPAGYIDHVVATWAFNWPAREALFLAGDVDFCAVPSQYMRSLYNLRRIPHYWPFFGCDEASSSFNPWTAPSTNVTAWISDLTTPPESAYPVVWNERVFVGTAGSLSAYNESTGAYIWSFSGFGQPNYVAAGDDKVFVGTDNLLVNYVYSLNASTGAELWNVQVDGPVHGPPVVDLDMVYFGCDLLTTGKGRIYGVNQTTRTTVWDYETPDGVVSVAVAYGKLYASYGVLDDPTVKDAGALCLNMTDGDLFWNYDSNRDVASDLSIADGRVYVSFSEVDSGADCKVLALNSNNGNVIWDVRRYSNGEAGRTAVAYGKVFLTLGHNARGIYALDATNGDEIWAFPAQPTGPLPRDQHLPNAEAIADDRVYFAVSHPNKTIYAVDQTSGVVIWKYELPGSVNSKTIAVSNGRAFAVDQMDWKLYAFGPSNRVVEVQPPPFEPPNYPIDGIRCHHSLPTLSVDSLFFNFYIDPATMYGPILPPGTFDETGIPSDFFGNDTWGIHVRKAFAYSFDYNRYLSTAHLNTGTQPATAIIPGLPYHDPTVDGYYFNLAEAIAAFKNVPDLWDTGFTITFVKYDTTTETAANLMKKMIECLNPKFHVAIMSSNWYSYYSDAVQGKLPLFIMRWLADFPDPHDFAFAFYHTLGTFSGWQSLSDPTFDAMIETGIATAEGPSRENIYSQIQQRAVQNCPSVPILQPKLYHFERDWVVGWYHNPMYPDLYFANLWKWYYVEEALQSTAAQPYSSRLPVDVNYDGKVDMRDIGTCAASFMATYGPPIHPRWVFRADINCDRKIDMKDIGLVAKNFGATSPVWAPPP